MSNPGTRIQRLGGESTLEPSDIPDLTAGCRAVLDILADGEPHSGPELQDRLPQQREILRRVRELREVYDISCWRGKGRVFWYQLAGRRPTATREVNERPCPHCQGTGAVAIPEAPPEQDTLFPMPRVEWD